MPFADTDQQAAGQRISKGAGREQRLVPRDAAAL